MHARVSNRGQLFLVNKAYNFFAYNFFEQVSTIPTLFYIYISEPPRFRLRRALHKCYNKNSNYNTWGYPLFHYKAARGAPS